MNTQSHHYEQSTALQSPYDIEELQVQTGTMNAEFGNGVTSTNVITKKGTNGYHGTLYEYFRVNNLDAAPFFTNLTAQKNPHYDQNQFGATFGGPIKKDKLFFFANYEGYRLAQDATDIEEVPSAALRQGNFAGWSRTAGGPQVTIYNPYSYDPNTGLRTPFPNNAIPLGPTTLCSPRPTCVDPVALKYLQNWVTPANGTFNGLPALIGTARTVMDRDQGTGRIDWAKSESSTIYGRYSNYQSGKEFAGGAQPLEGTGNPYSSQNMVIHWTKSISADLVNDLMAGYSRPIWILQANGNVPDVSAQVGVLNVRPGPGGPSFAGTEFNLDNTYLFWFIATENKIQLKDDLNWSRGRHNLKFGFEGINSRFIYPTLSDSKGAYSFGIYWTALCPVSAACTANAPGGTNAGGDAYADFLLGGTAGGGSTLFQNTPDEYVGHQMYYGAYLQDSWRATRKLTVNLGLRYELWTPWLVPNNTTVGFNFATGNIQYALQNPVDYLSSQYCYGACAPLNKGVPRQGYTLGEKNFAPRVGLAYALSPTTVLRAGFGIYFDANANNNQFSNIQTGAAPFFFRAEEDADLSQEFPGTPYLAQNLFPLSGPTSIPKPNDTPTVDTFRFVFPYYPIPAVDEWSFSVQKQLGAYWGAEVSYLGSHSVHEPMFIDNNAPELPQGAAASLSLQQRRLFPQWGTLGSWIPIGYAKYDALMADIKNREWHGMALLGSWTWAKNLASSNVASSDQGDTNFRFRYIHAGPSQLTPAQSFRVGYDYRLPFGPGRQFAGTSSPLLGKLVGGWSVSGITTLESGTPYYVSAPDETNTSEGHPTANLLQNCKPNNGPHTRFEWFNTARYAIPAAGTVGNSTEGSFTDPGINNWDISLIKDTKTGFPREGEVFSSGRTSTMRGTIPNLPGPPTPSPATPLVKSPALAPLGLCSSCWNFATDVGHREANNESAAIPGKYFGSRVVARCFAAWWTAAPQPGRNECRPVF